MTFDLAQERCTELGMELAMFKTEEEVQILNRLMSKATHCIWIKHMGVYDMYMSPLCEHEFIFNERYKTYCTISITL